MSKWQEEEDSQEIVDGLEKGNGKAFLESIGRLRKLADNLDENQSEEIARTLSKRLWRERHPLVVRGSITALGVLAAGVTARVTLEAIARAPEKYPQWMWVPAAEALLRMGWSWHFSKHFLASMLNREIDLQKRVTIVQSINGMSVIGQQLFKDQKLVKDAADKAEPEVRDALVKLLEFAKAKPVNRPLDAS